MTALALANLSQNQDLDRNALSAVVGGLSSHIHYGRWVTLRVRKRLIGVKKFNGFAGPIYRRVYRYFRTDRQVNIKHTSWIGF